MNNMQQQTSNARPSCKSIVFDWNEDEFQLMVDSCSQSDDIALTMKHLEALPKNAKILEAGCGLGRVVQYLQNHGFSQVTGVEISKKSVDYLNKFHPQLRIEVGDVANLDFADNTFDAILSYGVVEHFPDGPQIPLKETYRILKPGGGAVITVPSFNNIRKLQFFWQKINPKNNSTIRKLFGKKTLTFNGKRHSFYVCPQLGDFYEYRFSKHQFENLCKEAGFQIVESVPVALLDGVHHTFGVECAPFKNMSFKLSPVGNILHTIFSKMPFWHNHMHACVVRKP